MDTKDRELLELAAKACGELTPSWYNNENYFDGVLSRWNPLKDDGDAFRLMTFLNLEINQYEQGVEAEKQSIISCYEPYDGNKIVATRRAIVRAAAEIGKEMQ